MDLDIMTSSVLLYIVSGFCHFAALIYGLLCLKDGEELFTHSSPRNLFKCRVEQKYWTVALGVVSNILVLVAFALYIPNIRLVNVGSLEALFAAFHVLDGVVTLIWHRITYDDIRSGKLCLQSC